MRVKSGEISFATGHTCCTKHGLHGEAQYGMRMVRMGASQYQTRREEIVVDYGRCPFRIQIRFTTAEDRHLHKGRINNP